jgi:hypothetical protein
MLTVGFERGEAALHPGDGEEEVRRHPFLGSDLLARLEGAQLDERRILGAAGLAGGARSVGSSGGEAA